MKSLVLMVAFVVSARAQSEPFDEFLNSIALRMPIKTQYLKTVLKLRGTKLAQPSLLEKWGVINSSSAASYNSVMNVIILKPEYITTQSEKGKSIKRAKNWLEIEKDEPVVWSARISVIFHEISHAEYSWLSKSSDAVDKELLALMSSDFDDYLKAHHPQISGIERRLARSELFAYYREDLLAKFISSEQDLLMQNGYFSSSKKCRNTLGLNQWFFDHPGNDRDKFVLTQLDEEFSKIPLPTVFVQGKDIEISPKDPVYARLQKALWNQWQHHFAPAKDKNEMVQWMNTQPRLLDLIKSCRESN